MNFEFEDTKRVEGKFTCEQADEQIKILRDKGYYAFKVRLLNDWYDVRYRESKFYVRKNATKKLL